MNLSCTNCSSEIKSENINISTDLAKCDDCGSIHKASDLKNTLENKDVTPPHGSRIVMNKSGNRSIELIYPKKGFSLSLLPQLFFAIFWLGFISFWTTLALRGSIIFAMFSIPFWIIGLNMIAGIINAVNEVQTITLDKYQLNVSKQRPIRPKLFKSDLKDIQSIKMKNLKTNSFSMIGNFSLMMKMQKSFGGGIEMPAIITGQKTEYFFENANDAEQEWVTSTLDGLVKGMRN